MVASSMQDEPATRRGAAGAMSMSNDLPVRRLPVRLEGDDRRVILRPFVMSNGRVRTLFERLDAMPEEIVVTLLADVSASFADRHVKLAASFDEHFKIGVELTGWNRHWSKPRQSLAGAYLTMEYAVDSAALFNPSIVAHPNQSDLPAGAVRFLMSLRATGEGHVSSIVFRTGTISADLQVSFDPLPSKLSRARVAPDRSYERTLFGRKLGEVGIDGIIIELVLQNVPERFTLRQLSSAVEQVRPATAGMANAGDVLQTILFLAQSNYHIDLEPGTPISELVIFPMSADESRGIEDLRLVRFVEDDGSVLYYGTYNAYNGFRTLPMMMCSQDFRRIEIHSLNGSAALNKGMALFPRRIGGNYVMCSRIDGENLFISYSDAVHFWNHAERLMAPKHPWELMQIGNCGSPIETPQGWLVLTHGVGPMRCYAIGVMLLDLHDPLKVIGHLREPLIVPLGEEREGYVPNVVYTCGAMVHGNHLLVPFAQADKSTGISAVELSPLIDRLIDSEAS
jgi:predicted GH43/DUF377 family glycosyl hydrolase